MTIRFTTRAVADLAAAVQYYAKVDGDLGLRFREDLDTAIERVVMFPHGAPPVDGFPGLRRARMRRFPYGIFYRPDPEESVVVRVLHAKQAWFERARGRSSDITSAEVLAALDEIRGPRPDEGR